MSNRTRTRTRERIPLASIDILLEQVGVAHEQIRNAVDPRFGMLPTVPETPASVIRDLGSAQHKLAMAMQSLRAMRYDA